MSAAATAITVEHDIAKYYASAAKARSIHWYAEGLTQAQTVQGIVHVDDSLIFSKSLCYDCLEYGATHCWPREIGMEVEQRGPEIVFLHIRVSVRNEVCSCPVSFAPAMPNAPYARGTADFPKISRVPPFSWLF